MKLGLSEHPPARTRTLLVCLFYELIVFLALWIILVLGPHTLLGFVFKFTSPGWVLWLHAYLMFGVISVWQWSGGRRSLPMKTWKLELRTDQGANLSVQHAVMRYFWAWPSYALLGIGIVWALLFDLDGKLLHDRLARTRIVREG